MARFEKVLVCIDGSESSMKAADYAVMLAKQNNAEVIGLNVIVSQLGYAYSAGAFGLVTPNTINNMLEKSKQEAQKWFDEIGKNAVTSGVKFKTEVVASPTSTVPAIVDYADRNKVDLIVVGTRGRSGFTKLLLGSVASGVVTYASCPVMVVK
ncbi:MAG: universal stress protein [Thermoproteota archaeon]|nr:universal stress protein [Thermoproteota archaeon]